MNKVCTVLFSLLAAASWAAENAVVETRPNIIFILADDLGYGDLGCYGQEVVKTPHIDRMAKEGLRFTQFYAGGPVCTSSRACLMAGMHNGNTPIKTMEKPLADEDVTLGEALKSCGYQTGMIGKWGLGNVGSGGEPNLQGFDFSYGYYSHIRAHNSYPDYLYRDGKKDFLDNEVVYITDTNHYAVGIGAAASKKKSFSNELFTREGVSFIDRNAHKKPFFLYLAYTIPHANNEAWLTGDCGMEVPDYGAYAEKDWPEAKKAGASMIEYLDRYVGQIFSKLTEEGIAENTIVIFSSDNGPHGEGGWSPNFFDSNGMYRGMKRDMYEGGIRVPFIVWCPAKYAAGERDEVRAFWDVMPTFCELAGTDSPKTDGFSFVPALKGKDQKSKHEFLYWEFRTPTLKQAVRKGDWKAIRIKQSNKTKPTELYNLANDVVEENNVASGHPDKVAELEKLMDQFN